MRNNKSSMRILLRQHRRQFYCVFVFVSIILVFYNTGDMGSCYDKIATFMEESPAKKELDFYIRTLNEQCSGSYRDAYFEMKFPKPVNFPKPKCKNLLKNLTKGEWIQRGDVDIVHEKEVNLAHDEFRKQAGIPLKTWRSDRKCGHHNLARKITKWWPQTAAFCNPHGPTPCCTNIKNGKCVATNLETKCDCIGCVDTRLIKDALFSTWVPTDKRCKWKRYSSSETCAVLNSLSKPDSMAHLYFVGDSLMRNMFMGLTTILTDNLPRGVYKKCLSKELRELCWGENLFVRRPCHDLAIGFTLEQLEKSKSLCDGNRYFKAEYKGFGLPQQDLDFVEFVKSLHGKENSYIILGVGLHFSCKDGGVISKYLQPVLSRKPYWPRVFWAHPTSIGLLKPPSFIPIQGDEAIRIFANNIESFLKHYNVPVFDFRPITKAVRSYDGTHYGTGVNIMKAQVLLNYLATLK